MYICFIQIEIDGTTHYYHYYLPYLAHLRQYHNDSPITTTPNQFIHAERPNLVCTDILLGKVLTILAGVSMVWKQPRNGDDG